MTYATAHDTDPAPARGDNGHGRGRDDSPYPCAVHEAAIVEQRAMAVEVRDALRAVATRLDAEVDARKKWAGEVEYALLESVNAVKDLVRVIGHAPDPSTGTPGDGMRGQIAIGINHVLRGEMRAEMPSVLDDDESEVTAVQDRDTLLGRARVAERQSARSDVALIEARAKARNMLIAAIVGGIVTVITAAASILPRVLGGGP